MADLNALIAQGYQFQPLPDPFAQYGKMQQLENSATQNRLAQQQMQENAQMAPLRMQEMQARLKTSNLAYDQAIEAKDYISKVMGVAAEHGGPTDPLTAAKQMLAHPNAQIQAAGKHLADSYQLIQGIDQQQRYDQRKPSPTGFAAPAAAPTAAYMPESALGTLGGPTPAMSGALGSGTFDVNAVAPVANALAPTAPAVNALRPGAVTAESVAAEIRQGNTDFGNAPGWVKDREILMKQYEALLNPRQRTFAPIDASKYTPESIRAFNVSGDQSDLVAVAPKDSIYAAIDPSKYTPASLAAFEASGKRSDLIAIAPKDNIFAAINPSDYTPASVAAFEASGKRSDLVARDKPFAPPAPERVFAAINPSEYTQASLKAFSVSGDRSDLVARDKPVAPERLFAPINPSDYTPASVSAFEASGNRSDLVARDKPTKTESTMGKVDIDKFTPASLAKYAKSGDYLDLVALPPKPTAAATPAAPVAVVGADGKIKYVSREEAISKGMTPASAQEGLAPKEIQAREAKYPAATSAVKTFESKTESLAADLEKLAKHPGLSGISGLIYGRTPAVTQEARAAQALYDSIVARGGFAELQNMRAASPTGGALGNVSNQEGQYLRDAFAPINRTQDTRDLSKALTNAANAARASKQRVREAYDMTYDYKTANTPAAGGEWKVVK